MCIIRKDAIWFAGLFVSLVQSFVIPQTQPLFHHLRVQLNLVACDTWAASIHSPELLFSLVSLPLRWTDSANAAFARGVAALFCGSDCTRIVSLAQYLISLVRCAVIYSFVAFYPRLRELQALSIVFGQHVPDKAGVARDLHFNVVCLYSTIFPSFLAYLVSTVFSLMDNHVQFSSQKLFTDHPLFSLCPFSLVSSTYIISTSNPSMPAFTLS